MTWWGNEGRPAFSKALVQRYRVEVLEQARLSTSTINQRLSAIRKLATEAADNGLLPQDVAMGVEKVKGVRTAGGGRGIG